MRYFYSVCRAEQYCNMILSSHFVFYFRRQMFVKLAKHFFVGSIKVPSRWTTNAGPSIPELTLLVAELNWVIEFKGANTNVILIIENWASDDQITDRLIVKELMISRSDLLPSVQGAVLWEICKGHFTKRFVICEYNDQSCYLLFQFCCFICGTDQTHRCLEHHKLLSESREKAVDLVGPVSNPEQPRRCCFQPRSFFFLAAPLPSQNLNRYMMDMPTPWVAAKRSLCQVILLTL